MHANVLATTFLQKNSCTVILSWLSDSKELTRDNSLISIPLSEHARMVDPWWQPMAPVHLQEPVTDWRSQSTGGT